MQIVTAAVMEKDGKILIARRCRGDHLAHKWELPGGKLEPNETPEECLQRELREELGIETAIGDWVASSDYEYSHMKIRLMVYRVRHVSGAITVRDHEAIAWVSRDELAHFDFSEADKPIIRKLAVGG